MQRRRGGGCWLPTRRLCRASTWHVYQLKKILLKASNGRGYPNQEIGPGYPSMRHWTPFPHPLGAQCYSYIPTIRMSVSREPLLYTNPNCSTAPSNCVVNVTDKLAAWTSAVCAVDSRHVVVFPPKQRKLLTWEGVFCQGIKHNSHRAWQCWSFLWRLVCC